MKDKNISAVDARELAKIAIESQLTFSSSTQQIASAHQVLEGRWKDCATLLGARSDHSIPATGLSKVEVRNFSADCESAVFDCEV